MGLFGGFGRRLKGGQIADGLAAAQAALAGDYMAMARINEMTRGRRAADKAAAMSLHEFQHRGAPFEGGTTEAAGGHPLAAVGGPADPAQIGVQLLHERPHLFSSDGVHDYGAARRYASDVPEGADSLPFGAAGLTRPAAWETGFGGPDPRFSPAPGWRTPAEAMSREGGAWSRTMPLGDGGESLAPRAWMIGYQEDDPMSLMTTKTMMPVEVEEDPAPPPPPPPAPDPQNLGPPIVITGPRHRLGNLSRDFESVKGGPGTISSGRGDAGGASYGLHQFSSKRHIIHEFVASPEAEKWRKRFDGLKPVTPDFDAVWKKIGKDDSEEFAEAQYAFAKRRFYDFAVEKSKRERGLSIEGMSMAMKDVIWSTAIQHGENTEIINDAIAAVDKMAEKHGFKRGSYRYEEALINRVYDGRIARYQDLYRTYKSRNYRNVYEGRFPQEREAALEMLRARRGR
jgi:hypothetical protein